MPRTGGGGGRFCMHMGGKESAKRPRAASADVFTIQNWHEAWRLLAQTILGRRGHSTHHRQREHCCESALVQLPANL